MAFFSKKIGIDLGTANTLVVVPGKGIVVNEPSVVALDQETGNVLAVGFEAKEMVGKTPESIIAYRPMKDGVIANYHVTEAMLRHFMGKALGRFHFFKPEVLISVPAGVSSTERRAVIEAALKAGARAVHIVKEPIVSAIGGGIPIYESQGHIVVDIGGGTTDVAVISLGGVVASTSVKCAGTRMDQSIVDYLKKKHNLAIGERTAEKIKIKIGAAVTLTEELEILVKGRDTIQGLPRSVRLSTNDIVGAIQDDLRRITDAIKDVLQQTPPELSSDIIDNGVIMTGGSSQLRNLTDLVFRTTGVKARLAEEPLFCVAKGLGVVLEHLDTYKRALVSKKTL
jgi:rod shape-determining protein MreB and related proteins